jgi:hypothetical protein
MNPGIRDHYFTRFARRAESVKLRNTLALSCPQWIPHFTASGKFSNRRRKRKGYTSEAFVFVF